MLPILNADLEDFSVKLLALIIKPGILENYNVSLGLIRTCFLIKKDVHLGFAEEQEFRQLRLRDSWFLKVAIN